MVPIQQFYLGNPQTPSSSSYPRPQSMSQASLTNPNTNPQQKTHANHQSVPVVHASPASPVTNQHTPPSKPSLGPTPEEADEKADDDDDEEETSKQPKRAGRRREGTMNKSFRFPPDPTPSESPPPVPHIPEILPASARKQRPSADGERARKSDESDEVAVVASPNVEVPPPPPIEKERTASSVSDLDDVGETEEISLN